MRFLERKRQNCLAVYIYIYIYIRAIILKSMKKASLFAAIGSGVYVLRWLYSLYYSVHWIMIDGGSSYVWTEVLMDCVSVFGWVALTYFFVTLYRKQR